MIKLKKLLPLQEMELYTERYVKKQVVWKVPEGVKGAPADVIDVIHRIISVAVNKTDKEITDFNKIFKLYKLDGYWLIENRINKDVLIAYNGYTFIWWIRIGPSPFDMGGHWQRLATTQINHIVKHWMEND